MHKRLDFPVVMPVKFTEDDGFPPPAVETVTVMDHGDDSEEGDDDEASCATGTSVSDYAGDGSPSRITNIN